MAIASSPAPRSPATPAPSRRSRAAAAGWTPYLLLLPGLAWLASSSRCRCSPSSGPRCRRPTPAVEIGAFDQTFRFAQLRRRRPGVRAAAPAVVRLRRHRHAAVPRCIGYPLAYLIAFKAGPLAQPVAGARRRAVLHQLHPAHARLAADPGRRRASSSGRLKYLHVLPAGTGADRQYDGRHRRPHVQLPAVHDAAALRQLERLDPRLLEAASDLYASPLDGAAQGHAAAVAARRRRRDAADLHPGRRRLRQRRAARQTRTG